MKSVWSDTAKRPQFEALKGDIKTDVLIIGGGIAGILCAYMLKKDGVDCVLVEADKICGGITKNTTAKITYQHGLIYDKIIREYGVKKARLYFEAHRDALEQYRSICEGIDCDFKECDSYVYSLGNKDKLEKELLAMRKIGCKATFTDKPDIQICAIGAIRVENQAQFHPLKFAFKIAKDLPIYENTKVLELVPDGAITKNGKITANKIIVATHFPFLNKHGSYFLKMYQHRSYVIALENAPDVSGMYVDESEKGMSLRNCGDLLLLGGGSHRTGKQGGNWAELERFAKLNFPQARVVYRWATQDCMTLDGIAYIGQYSKHTENLYVATGFNKWGMTSAMVSAMILKDLVVDKQNKYAEVFSPSRSVLHPQLAINTVEALKGILTPTAPRCPHMRCALKYNPQEHSWDCSCHGSRFTEKGQLIDNPATADINNKNLSKYLK